MQSYAPSLFADAGPAVAPSPDPGFAGAHRLVLDARSWVDVVPGWLAGAERWFDEITAVIRHQDVTGALTLVAR